MTTVEPLITHTSWWTAQAIGYEGSWVRWGILKKKAQKIAKKSEKIRKKSRLY